MGQAVELVASVLVYGVPFVGLPGAIVHWIYSYERRRGNESATWYALGAAGAIYAPLFAGSRGPLLFFGAIILVTIYYSIYITGERRDEYER